MDAGVGYFDLVEHRPYFVGRETGMAEILAKFIKRFFEVDVVFPKGIVGVDDQMLARHFVASGSRRKGISKMASTSTGRPSRRAGWNCHFWRAWVALKSRRSSRWWSTVMESMLPSP